MIPSKGRLASFKVLSIVAKIDKSNLSEALVGMICTAGDSPKKLGTE